eukprot:scaffold937_cov502-Prasinococcus_capsulatus_cf.AAC.5
MARSSWLLRRARGPTKRRAHAIGRWGQERILGTLGPPRPPARALPRLVRPVWGCRGPSTKARGLVPPANGSFLWSEGPGQSGRAPGTRCQPGPPREAGGVCVRWPEPRLRARFEWAGARGRVGARLRASARVSCALGAAEGRARQGATRAGPPPAHNFAGHVALPHAVSMHCRPV